VLRIISRKTAVLLRKEAPLLICTSDTAKILANSQGGSYAVSPSIFELRTCCLLFARQSQ